MSAFTLHTLTITRRVITYSSASDSAGSEGITTICTVCATVYRRSQQNINVDNAAPGSSTIETNAVAIGIKYRDNPQIGREGWLDASGGLLIHEGDIVTQDAAHPISALTGLAANVERIRTYSDGWQIDLRIGTEREAGSEEPNAPAAVINSGGGFI